jgi:hypothetical protein
MEKLAEIKHLYEEVVVTLARNQTAVLNSGRPESVGALYMVLSRLVEQTFSGYHMDFFLSRDYFKTFCEVHHLIKKFDPDVSIKLFEFVQLIVTNTRTTSDLANICGLDGFAMFFRTNFEFDRNDEAVDYFINIAKSLILKLDSASKAESVRPVVDLALGLSRHKDNLVRTTVRNIALALTRLDNASMAEYVSSFPFRFFFVDLVREIKEKIFSLDKCILEEKTKEIQDTIYFIQESFQFIDELISCARDDVSKQFITNLVLVGIFVQILLPAFRNDIRITGGHFLGINTVLFVFDSAFAWIQNPLIIDSVVFNMMLGDNLRLDCDEVFDMPLFFDSHLQEVTKNSFFQSLGKLNLFTSNLKSELTQATDKPAFLVSELKGKVFHTLLAFFKSKDDNMILITTNIFLHLFARCEIDFDQALASTLEKLSELLRMDPSTRLATCENLCRVFNYIVKHSSTVKTADLTSHVFALLDMKSKNIKKILDTDKFCDILISRFRKTSYEHDKPEFYQSTKPCSLTWLALYNYNYSAMQSKDLRYISLDFKVELNDEEFIEAEVRLFILFKNLRYSVIEESVLFDFEKTIPLVYQEVYASIDNPNFCEGACLLIDFEADSHLVRLFSGEITDSGRIGSKVYLASFGRDLILLEEENKAKRLYRIFFREYYANVIYYIHRSNPRQMNITLKSKVKFWGVLFPNAQVCLQAKNLLDEIFRDFTGKEKQFIGMFLKKYETDVVG